MEKELFNYYKNALVDNLCSKYRGYWQAASHDKLKLLHLALSQQAIPHWLTYAYEGRGITKDYVLENFGDYINGNYIIEDADDVKGYTYQLYTDFKGISTPSGDVCVFAWCNSTYVDVKATKCPIFYVGCNSDLHISLYGYNSLVIYLFDESVVTIEDADETSSVYIYRYSQKADVIQGKYCICNKFRIFDKTLRL